MTEEPAEVENYPFAEPRAPIFLVPEEVSLAQAISQLLAGFGPLAIDAERASGFRYSSKAYLIQVFRSGCPTFLVDPIATGDLSALTESLAGIEWIIHAASQDLACLREVGIEPKILFDTELGARLAGLPRVGLRAVVRDLLGLSLAKEHSAADWSKRPLPKEWLHYAALDVELLPQVRDKVHEILEKDGKTELASEEFQAQLKQKKASPRSEPWRRLSGLHRVRGARALAIARELWEERDRLAEERDEAPGRLVPDSSLVAAIIANPGSQTELAKLKEFHGRASRTELKRWWAAINRGRETDDLPTLRKVGDGPPPPRSWSDKNPQAARRLASAREALGEIAAETKIPVENILLPETLRSLCWEPPGILSPSSVKKYLEEKGARTWQIALTAGKLSAAFVESI